MALREEVETLAGALETEAEEKSDVMARLVDMCSGDTADARERLGMADGLLIAAGRLRRILKDNE